MLNKFWIWFTQEPEDYRFLKSWFEKNDGKISYVTEKLLWVTISAYADGVKIEANFLLFPTYKVFIGKKLIYSSIDSNLSTKAQKLIYSKIEHLLEPDDTTEKELKQKYLA